MDKHHVVPLAIGGEGNNKNIIYIEHKEHKTVHNILNIPYKYIRKYRIALNGLLFLNENIIESERKMQLMYFENVEQLNINVLYEHYKCIAIQTKSKVKNITNNIECKKLILSDINKINDIKQNIIKKIEIISMLNINEYSESEKDLIKDICKKNTLQIK